MDDSCRRPGAVPFKWEVCPGTPKHARSSSAGGATPPPKWHAAKVAVAPKLAPPPAMAPSPYRSPLDTYSARSASVSPSRCRPRRPTAFLDVAPRAAVEVVEAPAAYRCFPLPSFRRRDRDGKKRGGGGGGGSGRLPSFGSDGAPAACGGPHRARRRRACRCRPGAAASSPSRRGRWRRPPDGSCDLISHRLSHRPPSSMHGNQSTHARLPTCHAAIVEGRERCQFSVLRN